MSAYEILKGIHIAAVVVSISLFIYRYVLLTRRPGDALAGPLKFIPHVNDTLLLVAAIAMLLTLNLNPFAIPWLMAKLVTLLFYIVLGAMCFRAIAGSGRQTVLFVLAMTAFAYMLFAALTKQVSPF